MTPPPGLVAVPAMGSPPVPVVHLTTRTLTPSGGVGG